MNNFLSCFGRGPWGGKPANPRSPLGMSPDEPTPKLYDRAVEALRTRDWRFPVMPTGKGIMQVRLNKS
jgi:hypothetical protein